MKRETLRIHEVGPRDGLQHEPEPVSTAGKIILLRALRQAGISSIEAANFANPDLLPHMADGAEVMASTLDDPDAHFSAVVADLDSYEDAVAAGARSVAVVVLASESLSLKHSGKLPTDMVASCRRVLRQANADSVRTRVYITPSWVCPYEGPLELNDVLRVTDPLWEEGVGELALADTIGHAHPVEVGRLFETLGKRYDMARLAAHFHDTQALGLANATAAISAGVRIVDGSIAGLGGCPYAPGAAGNLATEDLVFLAHKLGYDTGVDLDALGRVARAIDDLVGRKVGGRTREYFDSQPRIQIAALA